LKAGFGRKSRKAQIIDVDKWPEKKRKIVPTGARKGAVIVLLGGNRFALKSRYCVVASRRMAGARQCQPPVRNSSGWTNIRSAALRDFVAVKQYRVSTIRREVVL
jgi:hypothetical protein